MYSANVNGQPTTFGTSGLLYRSNKLMYDRATNSLWSQLLGEPVIGPLADSGIVLSLFPVLLTTWGEWRTEHPDTTVLALKTGQVSMNPASEAGIGTPRRYLPEDHAAAPYHSYFRSPDTAYPVWLRSDALEAKAMVLTLSIGDAHKAYPVETLQRQRVVNDELAGSRIVVISSAGSQAARVYKRMGHEFSLPADDPISSGGVPDRLVDSEGRSWLVTEEHLVSESDPSEQLTRLTSHVAFWFGWFAFHPDTDVYLGDGGR